MDTGRLVSRFAWAATLAAVLSSAGCGREGYDPAAPTPCDGILCSGHGTCADLDGAPYCVCDDGYYADGLECLELIVDNPCAGITCSGYGVCAVRGGEAVCVCAQGYHNPADDRANCVPDTHPCDGEDGSPCDDTEFCTVDDICVQGLCRGQPNDCSDGNSCTVDICNELEDRCVGTAAPDLTPCDDGRYCTLGEVCQAGLCAQGYERNCEDGNSCTDDRCDVDTDSCVNEPANDGSACDDGAFCSEGETCLAGACAAGQPRNCDDGNLCTLDICDESLNECLHESGPNEGQPCDDGSFCTMEDRCASGICAGGGQRNCSDGNSCTLDSCDEVQDSCVSDASASDGVPCNDSAFCTIDDTCSGGVCQGGSPRDCDDGNLCTLDMCDEVLDTCVGNGMAVDGAPCDDGLYCNTGEVCTAGFCAGGAPRGCEDASDCTFDTCDENADTCLHDEGLAEGRPCDDGDFCSLGETCLAGACQGGVPNPCDDGDPCTADACDQLAGACTHDPAGANGTACDDGSYCTVADACQDGVCLGGSPRECGDPNPCTVDACNEISDQCTHAAVVDGTVCDDGLYCNTGETCTSGFCTGGGQRPCSDGLTCTLDACDELADTCTHDSAAADGLTCSDGQFCTQGESCLGGACQGGAPNPCGDGNVCTVDTCDEGTDACQHDGPGANGLGCDDNAYCTVSDACQDGVCAGGAPRVCSDGNSCTQDSCDEVQDTCTTDAAPMNGAPCDDGAFCSTGETCSAGACTGGTPRTCSDGNPCTQDACDELADACSNNPAPANGLACDDGQFCTLNETCLGGACQGGAPNLCADGNTCSVDTCDEGTNQCLHDGPAANGLACDDAAYCTQGEACLNGACVGGTPRVCTDGNPCTQDSCDEVQDTCAAVAAPMNGAPCEDGAFCSTGETCSAGACVGGTLRSCSDGNACTLDSCDETNDACLNDALAANGLTCNDSQFCTVGETCLGGACQGGSPNLCSDGNTCSVDTCDEGTNQCLHDGPAANGLACDDAAYCTQGEACLNGACVGGTPRVCTDGNPCTQDSCDEVQDTCAAVAAPMNGAPCEDGAFCSTGETCSAGACVGGTLRSCSDGNACTLDSCDETNNACLNDSLAANGLTCNDGLFCSTGETCLGGACQGGAPNLCSDGNTCTVDSCNEGTDACLHDGPAANGLACDDNAYCSLGESCLNGACQGGVARVCSDGNPCTQDSCDEVQDTCTAVAAPMNGAPCDDGMYCSTGETCSAGACTGGSPRSCSDASPCTLDSCDEATDACINDAVGANGVACDDGQFCTQGETCSAGACTNGTPNPCTDGNVCTADSCDEGANQCLHNGPAADGLGCDDNAYCTVSDACQNGVCTGGAARVCTDGNPCTQDSCDEVQDTCVGSAAPMNGAPCDDGAYCSTGETCSAGSCTGGSPRTCSDGNGCSVDSCDEASDACINNAAAANGLACDDGAFCTQGETCSAGACTNGTPNLCTDGNVCTADSCDEGTNQCLHNGPAANGLACNDNAYCTVGEACSNGACAGGSPRDCDDSNACTLDTCDEVLDSCVGNGAPMNGSICNDGLYCNTGETCAAGICAGGIPRLCNDANTCTADSCSEATDACVYDGPAADGLGCNDGLFCTLGETCLSGACQGGSANPCNDGNVCTADSCDTLLDTCEHDGPAADGLGCDDGAYCTINDACTSGTCVGGVPLDCADANACTADSCNEVTNQCVHPVVADGTACNDGAYCSVGETCTAGACSGSSPRACSDGNPCTVDSCNEAGDVCVNDAAAANGQVCDDGAFCVTGESCLNGACAGGAPRNCSDLVLCTADVCNEATDTCDHDGSVMNGTACDDGNFCLVNETCTNGACGNGTVRACDDGNSCTANNCNEALDACQNPGLANGSACEDGLFCTLGDTCQGGLCAGGPSDPCLADVCANFCDEGTDSCGGCSPAGTYCASSTQAATCDGACHMTSLTICPYECNATRQECNECEPSVAECKGNAELLCNADHACSADGLLTSITCCTTNRCTCDKAECLEDQCLTAADLSAGGTVAGTTCTESDHIPGDCNPGGTACQLPAGGGAPEAMFHLDLDDGLGTSRFYNISLNTSGSALDTFLRLSSVCGNESQQLAYAGVCNTPTPGVSPATACTSGAGPDSALLCGMPEGEYFGAVDGPASTCGTYTLTAVVTAVSLDLASQAGNVSRGGTFTGTTCGLADNYKFPDTQLWDGAVCGDCTALAGNALCPLCDSAAAADCTVNSTEDKCAYSGLGSPDAVFYLALAMDSGVDITTDGSNFDTVIYLMQTGPTGPNPPGINRVCNDDCKEVDGASHIQTSLPAGLYYLYLDGANGACGNYVMRVVVSPAATCGNLVCESPYESCSSCPGDCTCPHCGDGTIQEYEGETCDDGDTQSGDCCASSCWIEAGCACYGEPSTCGVPTPRSYSHTCACAIPDSGNTPPGTALNDTVSVPVACVVAGITVDVNITHTYKSDLVVTLRSPTGTVVTLHNRTGGGDDNIVGTYETTLFTDGPGELEDFLGLAGQGTWTLTAQDWFKGDAGTLNSWGIHLQCL
ncbi:MAG TPA: proprotein convertase P-domain-containing protein [Myxococcota bacterium]|nr:proprotein convertase P-domain-containing protein [Myxococcota bacterium]HRY94700.1 proprotein convertase P-domain-containing protein [Myxococcota bacterium]